MVSTVLRTTLEMLGQQGYAGLRVEDVAARAGVNKTTIYRRWPTRADLVVAALTSLATPPVAVETGRLACDLKATFMTATTLRSTPVGRGVVRHSLQSAAIPKWIAWCARSASGIARPRAAFWNAPAGEATCRSESISNCCWTSLTGTDQHETARTSAARWIRSWVGRVVRLVLSGAVLLPRQG